MRRVEMDFHGQRIVVEFEGPENPIDFLTRRLAEVKTHAGRERTRGDAYAAMARQLAKQAFDKPSPGSKETESAFRKRVEKWTATTAKIKEALEVNEEIKAFTKARSAQIAALADLDAAMTNTYPDMDCMMRPGGNYSPQELPTLPFPWYGKVVRQDAGLKKHMPFDLHDCIKNRFTFGELLD